MVDAGGATGSVAEGSRTGRGIDIEQDRNAAKDGAGLVEFWHTSFVLFI